MSYRTDRNYALQNTQIVGAILDRICKPLLDSQARLNRLRQANDNLIGGINSSFKYKGIEYPKTDKLSYAIPLLHENLHEEMETHLHNQYKLFNYDIPYIQAFLTAAVTECRTFADLKKVLPECIHRHLEKSVIADNKEFITVTDETVKNIHTIHAKAIGIIKEVEVYALLKGGE